MMLSRVLSVTVFCIIALGNEGLCPKAYSKVKEVHIDSSAETKKELLESFVFQLLHSLYPNGRADSSLSAGQLRKILKEYQAELEGAVSTSRRHSAAIRTYFGHEPELQHIPKLRVLAG